MNKSDAVPAGKSDLKLTDSSFGQITVGVRDDHLKCVISISITEFIVSSAES